MQKVVKNGFKLDLRIHTFFITFSNRNISEYLFSIIRLSPFRFFPKTSPLDLPPITLQHFEYCVNDGRLLFYPGIFESDCASYDSVIPSFFKRERTAPLPRFNVTAISLTGTPFWCRSSKHLSCSGDQGCP